MDYFDINDKRLYPHDVWLERSNRGDGHYYLCVMRDDGTIIKEERADPHTFREYWMTDTAEDAFGFIMDRLAHRVKALLSL